MRNTESGDDLEVISYVRGVWADRVHLALFVIGISLLAVAISFLIPPTFEATTTLMPVGGQETKSLLGAFSAGLEDLGLPAASRSSPLSYPDILKSRRILVPLLSREFETGSGRHQRLIDIIVPDGSGPKREERALRLLNGDLRAAFERRSGILTISVSSRNPKLAADVANALDSLLVQLTIDIAAGNAGVNRRFVEGRLKETRENLALAEERLTAFRQGNLRIGNSPRLATEEARLTRAVREQEEIHMTLSRQYELAKIEEHRDTPSLVILDRAVTPIFKSGPKRLLIVLFSGAVALLIGTAFLIAKRALSSTQMEVKGRAA